MTEPSGNKAVAGEAGPDGGRKSIMRSLGEFFGHIAHAVRTDPAKPAQAGGADEAAPVDRQVVRRTVEEEERETARGKVTLRRTIIEEVDLPREDVGPEGKDRGA